MSTGEKIVNRTVINNDETLCTFDYVYGPDQGMFAYPQEGDRSPIKIQNMVIKSKGNYEYYDNESVHYIISPYDHNWFLKNKYNKQEKKYTDGVLTPEEARMSKGGYKRKSKSQRRRKSIKKSIKRRH